MTEKEAKRIMENAIYNYRPIGDSMVAFGMAITALEQVARMKKVLEEHKQNWKMPFSDRVLFRKMLDAIEGGTNGN